MILDFLSNKELTAGEIYSALNKEFAERTLRKAISDLEEKKAVKTKKIKKGKGVTRVISKA